MGGRGEIRGILEQRGITNGNFFENFFIGVNCCFILNWSEGERMVLNFF